MTSGDILALLPLATLVVGAFIVYLFARLVTEQNGVLALATAGIFGVTIVALILLIGRCSQLTSSGLNETCPWWGNSGPNAAAAPLRLIEIAQEITAHGPAHQMKCTPWVVIRQYRPESSGNEAST